MALDYITEGLQRLPSLSVVPMPAAVEASRSAGANVQDTVAALNGFRQATSADVVISGAYYSERADSLMFQARVSDANGKVLIAIGPVYSAVAHPEAAITEIRSRVMGYFASMTDDRLSGRADVRETPPTYEAYSDFSAGMSDYLRSDFGAAATKFVSASARDSTFATPLLFASISLSNLRRFAEADSVAHVLLRMRQRLNPYYQDWLDFRLALLAGDRPKALVAVRQLASRAPATKATYNLALEAQENGYLDEGLRAIRSLPPDRGPMRGWVSYWDELGSLLHLKSDYSAELDAGRKARDMYPDRMYALVPSVRALAALGRTSELTLLLDDAARMKDDRNGTSLGLLLREAGAELRAHGHLAAAESMFARGTDWYTKRLGSSPVAAADSLALARLLYDRGSVKEAAALMPRNSADAETVGLSGMIDARSNRVDNARAAMARLTADKRPYQFGEPQIALARIAALLGDSAIAISALREAFAAGKEYDLWIHRTSEFDGIRTNTAFVELVRPRR